MNRSRSSSPAGQAQALLPFEAQAPRFPHPFVDQLAALCAAQPTRAKWVIVPSLGLGYAIGDVLARDGAHWVNLRFVTPLQLAIRMAGPFLVERGIDPSEDTLGPALVMRLLADLDLGDGATGADALASGYFKPMAEHTTLAAALWSTVRELRVAGVRADDLPAAAFESARKHAELTALLGAYERHLETHRLADMAAVFAEAPAHRDFCPIDPADLTIEVPDVAWPHLVRAFLDVLPGEVVPPRGMDLPGLDVPRRVAGTGRAALRVSGAVNSDASRLQFLRAPERAGAPARDGTLTVLRAGGRDAEVEEVFRRVLAASFRLDEVEIVGATHAQALLAWEKARRLGWPVTLSAGVPSTMTRPGRALLAWCRWIQAGFGATDLRQLLLSGDVAPSAFERTGKAGATEGTRGEEASRDSAHGERGNAPDTRLSAPQAARLLVQAEAAWGRETYRRTLGRFAERNEARARHEGLRDGGWRLQRAADARRLLAWVERLLADVPEPDGPGDVAAVAVVDAAMRFLTENASRAGDLDAAAYVALGRELDALRAFGPMRASPALALRFVQEVVERTCVGASRARPGHLHVSVLADTDLTPRPMTLVVGLEEGRVFPSAIEDPVLLDEERTRIAANIGRPAALKTSRDRQDEAVFGALGRLAIMGLAGSSVTLSFSCVDTREFRDTFPSWLVLQAHRLLQGSCEPGYEHLRHGLGNAASVVPAPGVLPTSVGGWWLRAGRAADGEAAVLAAHPSVARGLEARHNRESDALTAHDGLVPAAGRVLDPTRRDAAMSPTSLEDAAKCPFRFFLRAGLGLVAQDAGERDHDVWLDPLRRGGELHDLYAAVTRRARAEGRRVTRDADREWLLARGRARLEDLRREMPPPSEEVLATESREFLDDLAAFVDAEEELRGITPLAFEVSFGFPLDDDGAVDDIQEREPLSDEEPVAIPLAGGRMLRVHGRIDRIDRLGQHDYQVVDYKTGRCWNEDRGTFVRGTLLQHALYGRAAERLLRTRGGDAVARVTRGVYWFPTGRGWGRRVSIARPDDAVLGEVLGDLVEVLRTGTFLQSPEERECARCDFAAACGSSPWDAAKRKAGADLDRLAAWIRLKERG